MLKKRIFPAVAVATALLAASCLKSTSSYYSGTSVISFDNASGLFDTDSTQYVAGSFSWGMMCFYSLTDKDSGEFDGGVVLARFADTTATAPSHFIVYGDPANSSVYYGVNGYITYYDNPAFADYYAMSFIYAGQGTMSPSAVYVNNTLENVNALSGMEIPSGSEFAVVFEGYRDSLLTGSARAKLAYKDSVVTSWTAVSLSDLSQADFIKVRLESDIDGVLPYVCLDDLTIRVTLGEQ